MQIQRQIFGRLLCTAGVTVCDEKCCHTGEIQMVQSVSVLSWQSFQMGDLAAAP